MFWTEPSRFPCAAVVFSDESWAQVRHGRREAGHTARPIRHPGIKLDAALIYRFTPRFSLGVGGGLLRPSSDGAIRQAFAQIELGF
ncbi:hypothetical protein [Hydrocarboniphaga sp.]|uniref:hypothetical protein n=1 Tax=Hydrocarboniphaga sp. TaxID=2033016 RepID=UPI003D0D607D